MSPSMREKSLQLLPHHCSDSGYRLQTEHEAMFAAGISRGIHTPWGVGNQMMGTWDLRSVQLKSVRFTLLTSSSISMD